MGISETEKGSVLAAFFYGYSITPVREIEKYDFVTRTG